MYYFVTFWSFPEIAKLQISTVDLPVQQKKSGLLYIRVVVCLVVQSMQRFFRLLLTSQSNTRPDQTRPDQTRQGEVLQLNTTFSAEVLLLDPDALLLDP